MEDCKTPTIPQVIEFKYELTPSAVFRTNRLQETQNFRMNHINMRCFTPTVANIQSPGMSPIPEFGNIFNNGTLMKSSEDGFQKFMAPFSDKKYCCLSRASLQKQPQKWYLPAQQYQHLMSLPLDQQIHQEQAEISAQPLSPFEPQCSSDSHLSMALNSTTKYEADSSMEAISPESLENQSGNCSSSSALKNISNLLDRTLNMVTLLRSIGLEQYVELFEKHDLDLEEFLNINYEDLQRIGVPTHKHRQIIMDLLNQFNTA